MNPSQKVVIVGASDRPDRYAHKAMQALIRHGHEVALVHPRLKEIEGRSVVAHLNDVEGPVDTVTMYVSPAISVTMEEDLLAMRPKRVLFNPGSENPALQSALTQEGIVCEEACTLVLLSTGGF